MGLYLFPLPRPPKNLIIFLPPIFRVVIRIAGHPNAAEHEGGQEDGSGKDQVPHYRHLRSMVSE